MSIFEELEILYSYYELDWFGRGVKLDYVGNSKKLVNSLKKSIKYVNMDRLSNLENILFNSSIVLNDFNNYCIETDSNYLKNDLINFVKDLYKLEDFSSEVLNNLPFNYLERRVKTNADFVTWEFSEPKVLQKTFEKLVEKLENSSFDKISFLISGTGGTMPGIGIYNKLEEYLIDNGLSESDFYLNIFRMSHHKKDDLEPKITSDEKKELDNVLNNSFVIFFDEDVFTGKSMFYFCNYFKSNYNIKDSLFVSCYNNRKDIVGYVRDIDDII